MLVFLNSNPSLCVCACCVAEREDHDVSRASEQRVHRVCEEPENRRHEDVQLHCSGLSGENEDWTNPGLNLV